MKKLKNEAQLLKLALKLGESYARKRGVDYVRKSLKSDDIAKQAFLQALPSEVRLAMDGVDFTDPHKAADKADSLWCTHQQQLAGSITVSGVSRKTKPAKQKKNPDFCYYHDTFGESATKCKAPCSYQAAVNNRASHQ